MPMTLIAAVLMKPVVEVIVVAPARPAVTAKYVAIRAKNVVLIPMALIAANQIKLAVMGIVATQPAVIVGIAKIVMTEIANHA